MYYALSNQVPGGTPTSAGTLDAPRSIGPIVSLATFRQDLPPALVTIVDRAVARDPSQRFASAEEMRAALAPFANASLPPPALGSATATALPSTASPPTAGAPPPTAYGPPPFTGRVPR